MTAARKIAKINTPSIEPAASTAPATLPSKGRVSRLRRQPVFPPAEVMHRRPIEPEPVLPDPGRLERLYLKAGHLVQVELAAAKAERAAAERSKVRRLSQHDHAAERARRAAKADAMFRADQGADGAAMAGRPTETVVIDPASGETAKRVLDDNPLNAMGLDIRQEEAAGILADTWRDALPAMELPGDLGRAGSNGGGLSRVDQIWAERAWHDFRRWMGEVQRLTSLETANAVRDAVILRAPAPAHRVRAGLSVLVLLWDLR